MKSVRRFGVAATIAVASVAALAPTPANAEPTCQAVCGAIAGLNEFLNENVTEYRWRVVDRSGTTCASGGSGGGAEVIYVVPAC